MKNNPMLLAVYGISELVEKQASWDLVNSVA